MFGVFCRLPVPSGMKEPKYEDVSVSEDDVPEYVDLDVDESEDEKEPESEDEKEPESEDEKEPESEDEKEPESEDKEVPKYKVDYEEASQIYRSTVMRVVVVNGVVCYAPYPWDLND